MAFLSLRGVTKGFGPASNRTRVLDGIDLDIEKGEFVAIVGFSGSGKTTLVNLMSGLLRPDTGSATLNDLEITSPGPDRGVVFQNYSLLPWLSVTENIRLAVDACFPNWPDSRKSRHVEEHVAKVHLTAAMDRKPAQLSGGMRQRVSLARALAMDPQVLLLDEPLGALDALTRATLQDEIGRIWQSDRKTVVLITNDPDEGIYLADRVIPLTPGPGATLGPSFAVPLPRPRERLALHDDPRFVAVRREVQSFLLASRSPHRTAVSRKLLLPDLEPEDLDLPRFPMGRRTPLRRHEVRRETVELV